MATEQKQQDETVTLEQALATAISLHQAEQLDQAENIYRLILDQFPKCAEALHFLGLLHYQRRKSDEAIRLIEQALIEAPEYADAHNNLGNIFHSQGQLQKAGECYRKTLALNPNNIAAYNNLGIILKELEQFDEAIEVFNKAIQLMPDNPDFYRNLGNAHKVQGNFADAVDAYRKTLSLKAYDPEDYENLSVALYLQGKYDEAVPLLRQWLEHDPENPVALHRFAAFSGKQLGRASDDYIVQVFDNFANSFDYVLKNLGYKAPFLVAEAVEKQYGGAGALLHILDAGCGTGLCGPLIQSYADRLVGIDLSSKMLERAAKRDCYSQLICSELTSFIAAQVETYDLIVSADTLVYFGDISGVCEAARDALTEGGRFIFTLESTDENPAEGFKINPHGRFSHTENYVRNAVAAAGLALFELSPALLRFEGGKPVDGFLVVAARQARR
ncbi:MAG: tetratricopeptide repeat protein [Gammaproteobacteria bacterium]